MGRYVLVRCLSLEGDFSESSPPTESLWSLNFNFFSSGPPTIEELVATLDHEVDLCPSITSSDVGFEVSAMRDISSPVFFFRIGRSTQYIITSHFMKD